ncbi:MAG: DUF6508 domain-containing protein [Bacteroidota bacterium]
MRTIQQKDLQRLSELILEVENTTSFGELIVGEKDEEGVNIFPYYVSSPVVSKFLRLGFDLNLDSNFDWTHWDEGVKILNDENRDYSLLTCETLCKLVTTIVRKDRFCEGELICSFENGVMLKILKAFQKHFELNLQSNF